MRSLLAGLLVLLAAVASVAASAAYVAHRTVLDPAQSGAVLSQALRQPELRDQVLSRTVPGYDGLPASFKHTVDQVARSHQVDRVLRKARIDEHGRVHLGPVRREVTRTLRANGQPELAARLAALGGPATFKLPSEVAAEYTAAQDRAWWVATRGAAAAAILFVLALLVARNRRTTLAAIGLALLASVGVTVLVYARLPAVATTLSSSPWVQAAAATARVSASTVVSLLLPVLVAGVVLLLASPLVPRRR
jgi:hypothetical protein